MTSIFPCDRVIDSLSKAEESGERAKEVERLSVNNSIHIKRNIWNGCVTTEWTTKFNGLRPRRAAPHRTPSLSFTDICANKAIWHTDEIEMYKHSTHNRYLLWACVES